MSDSTCVPAMTTYYLDHLPNPEQLPPCVLSIGNFDGLHRGHQAMIKQLKQKASQHHLTCAAMVFEPQPLEFFAPQKAPARLTTLAEKQRLLARCGIDVLYVATFDADFRALSATAFADLLADRLQVKALVLGDDFRFGHDRSGDSDFLRDYGLAVTNLDTITDDQQVGRISSTRVRDALAAGHLKQAATLLGRDYAIAGQVVYGDQIGRTLDFPTANVDLARIKPSLNGVFAVDVCLLDANLDPVKPAWSPLLSNTHSGVAGLRPDSLFGVANVGTRPSVDRPPQWRLEVFFPQFAASLYDRYLDVRFLHQLHEERQYADLPELKAGIAQDVQEALDWRQAQPNPMTLL